MYSGNSKTRKVKNEMYQNNTVIGWFPNFRKNISIQLLIFNIPLLKKKLHSLAAGGLTPRPLVECPAKNESFLTCSLT